jgi:hypothetical protein
MSLVSTWILRDGQEWSPLFDEGARDHDLSFLPWASFQVVFFRSQLIARHNLALTLSLGPVIFFGPFSLQEEKRRNRDKEMYEKLKRKLAADARGRGVEDLSKAAAVAARELQPTVLVRWGNVPSQASNACLGKK